MYFNAIKQILLKGRLGGCINLIFSQILLEKTIKIHMLD